MLYVILLLVLLLLTSAAYAAQRGAPWVPTWKKDLVRIKQLAGLKPSERFIELGCGTGRVCRFIERHTAADCTGVELSIVQWLWAKAFSPKVHIVLGDVFHHDLSSYDVVYLFLMPETYAKIRPKFERELKPGTRVITYVWPLPNWQPVKVDHEEGLSDLYLYEIKKPAP